MTTTQMSYFLAAAQHLNFTLAAEQLYITQPALSRQIAAIENELGTKLFSRINNVVSLTRAGQALYERLTGLYSDYVSMVKYVQEVRDGTEECLNLGILEDQYIHDKMIQAIRHVLQQHPNCELTIGRYDSNSLFNSLREGVLDAGLMLIYEEFDEYGFSSLPLDISPARLAVRYDHPYAAHDSLTYEDLGNILEDTPLVMTALEQYPEPLQKSLLRFPPFDGIGPKKAQLKLISSIGSVALYVTTGLGVTLTNCGNLLANDPNVVLLPVKGIPAIMQGLVWRKNSHNPMLEQLVDFIKTQQEI